MLSSLELRAREENLRGEQAKRLEKERARQEKERAIAQRQKQREQAREEEKAQKRLALMEAERKARELREELTEHNRGVFWSDMLQAVPSDEAAVAAKGIKRAADKVTLPRSVGASLMDQDAPKNGAMMFEVRTPGGAITHASLLEFTAPEGVVKLPRQVADCLWGPTAPVAGPVTVTYKRLEKGTFVRFQPLNRGFHEAAGEAIREVLEAALMQCTALTEGDVIRVWVGAGHGLSPDPMPLDGPAEGFAGALDPGSQPASSVSGASAAVGQGPDDRGVAAVGASGPGGEGRWFQLLVQELQPSSAVSLIDTDMEAQVVPSLETEQAIKRMEEQRQQLEEERQERERQALEALRLAREEEALRLQQEQDHEREKARQREAQRAVLEATLPPEPDPEPSSAPSGSGSGSGLMTGLFRMPDGSRPSRRFLLSDAASLLFHFCDACGAGGLNPGSYRLVMQFPRRVIEPADGARPLGELGMVAGQHETLLLEPLLTPGPGDPEAEMDGGMQPQPVT